MLYLTTSEARAEACTLVLRLILRRVVASELRKLMAEAALEAGRIRHKSIAEEVDWLFHDLKLQHFGCPVSCEAPFCY